VKSQQLSAGGAPIAIRVALALKEWIADALLLSRATTVTGFSPLGITTASQETVASGVSALLSTPSAIGASGPNLGANDVPVNVIVRSAGR